MNSVRGKCDCLGQARKKRGRLRQTRRNGDVREKKPKKTTLLCPKNYKINPDAIHLPARKGLTEY